MDWHGFAKRMLLGHGKRIGTSAAEVARAAVFDDAKVTSEEFGFLLEVRREAKEVCPEFTKLVYDILEHALLRDHKIDASEVQWLRTVFLAGGPPTPEDLQYLRTLEHQAKHVCEEFTAMMREFEGPDRTLVYRPN